MSAFKEFLDLAIGKGMGRPCDEATQWLEKQATLEAAWNSCERPDWMHWALLVLYRDSGTILAYCSAITGVTNYSRLLEIQRKFAHEIRMQWPWSSLGVA